MSFDVTLPGTALSDAAQWAAALTPRRPTEPALAGVLLVAHTYAGGSLSFSGTDHDTTGTVTVTTNDVADSSRRLVSARLLADIAARLVKEPEVRLADSTDGDRLDVSTGNGWWSLPLLDANDYPALPQPAAAVASVGAATFGRALDRVSLAVSDPTMPPLFGGMCLLTTPEHGLVVASTDRFRLAVAEIDWNPVKPDEAGLPAVLVPTPILRAAVGAVRDATDDDTVTIHTDKVTFALSTPRHQVIGRLIDVKDPEVWRRIDNHVANTEPMASCNLTTEALKTALDRATVALDPNEAVAVTIDETGIEIAPSKGEKARAAHRAEHQSFDGAPAQFGVKPEYLRDLLTGLSAEVVRLGYLAGRNPMIAGYPLDDDGEIAPGFRMCQAPVSLNDRAQAAS